MIGTTRSRVSFFMNRFRKLGFVTTTMDCTCTVPSSLSSSTTSLFPLRHVDAERASLTNLPYFFKTEQFGPPSHPSLPYPLAYQLCGVTEETSNGNMKEAI